MNIDELKGLQIKIKALGFLNVVFLIINALLIVIPLYHYYQTGFRFDLYFIVITVLNIVGFYLSYIIADNLIYFKNKHRHFAEKIKTEEK